MSAEAICDGCGKHGPMQSGHSGWHKPSQWYERRDKDTGKRYIACSRRCVELVDQEAVKAGERPSPRILPL